MESLIHNLSVTIEKTDARIIVDDRELFKIYDEEAIENPYVATNSTGLISYRYFLTLEDALAETNVLASNPTDSGIYYLVINVNGDENTYAKKSDPFTVEITKRTLQTRLEENELIYNGKFNTPLVTVLDYKNLEFNYNVTNGNGIDVFNGYEMVITLKNANDNYIIANDTYTYSIVKKDLIISANTIFDYDNDNVWAVDVNTLTIEGLSDNHTAVGMVYSLNGNVGQYNLASDFDITNVAISDGENNVISNYNVMVRITLSILYPPVEYTVVDGTQTIVDGVTVENEYDVVYTYTGARQFAKITTLVSNAIITYTYDGRTIRSPYGMINAGTMDVEFTITAENYREVHGVIHFTVNPVQLEIELSCGTDAVKPYDRKAFTFTYTVTPLDVTPQISYYNEGVYTYTIMAPSRVGRYEAIVKIEDSPNYIGFEEIISIEIQPSEATIEIPSSYYSQTYTGQPVENPKVVTYIQNPEVTYVYYKYNADNSLELLEIIDGVNPVLEVGKYQISITVTGDSQIQTTTKTFDFEVTNKQQQVIWSNLEFIYGQYDFIDDYLPTAYIYDVDGNVVYLDVTVADMPYVMAGSFSVIANVLDGSNYSLIAETNKMIINKRRIEVNYDNDYEAYKLGELISYTFTTSDNVSNLRTNDEASIEVSTISGELGIYNRKEHFTYSALIKDSDGNIVTNSYDIEIRMFVNVRLTKIYYEVLNDGAELVDGHYVVAEQYNGVEHEVLAQVNEKCPGAKIEYLVDGTLQAESPKFINAGSYKVEITLSGEGYETVTDYITLVIDRIEYEFDLVENLNKEYDGYRVYPAIEFTNYDNDAYYYAQYTYFNKNNPTVGLYEAVEAGDYIVDVTVMENGNYTSTSKQYEFTIAKTNVSFTPFDQSLVRVFNGNNVEFTAKIDYEAFTESTLEVEYYLDGQLLSEAPKYVGTYEVIFKFAESTNYNAYESEKYTLYINKLDITLGKEYATDEYDVTPFTGNIYTFSNVFVLNGDSTWSIAGSVIAKSYAQGTYTRSNQFALAEGTKILFNGDDVTSQVNITFELKLIIDIASANNLVTITDKNITYDGLSHGIDIEISSDLIGTYKIYYGNNSSNYTSNPITYVNSGEYTVYYKIVFENYSEIRGYVVLTINKANASEIEIEDISKVYDGVSVKNPTITTAADGNASYSYYNASTNELLDVAPVNAGSYKVVVTISEGQNYEAIAEELNFSIDVQEVTLNWSNTELQYNGNELLPNAVASKVTFDDLAITVTANSQSINCGEYTATASINNDNYVLVNPTIEFEIVKRIVEMPQNITAAYTGKKITAIDNPYYYATENEFTNVGSYQLTVVLADKINYLWVDEEGNLTTNDINVAFEITAVNLAADIVLVEPIKDQNYTTKAVEPKPVVRYEGMILVEGVDYELDYENNVNAFINEDDYATVIITGIGNYYGTREVQFKIISKVFSLTDKGAKAKFFVQESLYKFYEQTNHYTYNSNVKIILTNVLSGQTVTEFLEYFQENQRTLITVYNANGRYLGTDEHDSTFVGTGFKLVLKDTEGTTTDIIHIAVHGDLNSDGLINSVDMMTIRNIISGNTSVSSTFFLAADINHDNSIDYLDYYEMYYYINGKKNFEDSYR